MKKILIIVGLILSGSLVVNAQQISGKSASFSYTYGLNKYFSAEQFKGIHPYIVQKYRSNILSDVSVQQSLFVPRGEFETDYDYKLRKERTIRFKYDVLRKYQKNAFYSGATTMLVKVSHSVKNNYLHILDEMFGK